MGLLWAVYSADQLILIPAWVKILPVWCNFKAAWANILPVWGYFIAAWAKILPVWGYFIAAWAKIWKLGNLFIYVGKYFTSLGYFLAAWTKISQTWVKFLATFLRAGKTFGYLCKDFATYKVIAGYAILFNISKCKCYTRLSAPPTHRVTRVVISYRIIMLA